MNDVGYHILSIPTAEVLTYARGEESTSSCKRVLFSLLCDSITITLLYLQLLWCWLRNSLPFFYLSTFKNFQSTPLLVHSTAIQFLWNCLSSTGIPHDSSSGHIIRIPELLVNYEFRTLEEDTIRHHQDNILATLEFPKNYIKIYIDSKAPRILRFFFYFFAKHHHQQPFDIPNTDLVIGLLLVRLIMMRPTTAPSRITHTNNILSILLLGEWRKINIPRILLSFLSPLYTPLCLGLATNAKRSETQ